MEDDLVIVAVATTCLTMLAAHTLKKKNKPKRLWSRPWISRRNDFQSNNVLKMLNQELKNEDPGSYKNFLRMTNKQFEYLYNMVKHDINKTDTHLRESISGRSRLELTLRFLATGESYRSLMYYSRIHESTISKFIPEVCTAIYERLQERYLTTPNTTEEWEAIAHNFESMWQFPNCVGALDGKHINFRPPISEGSYYYNYKGSHSIVLLALVDARYKFTYVNVGINGRISDGGVFHHSKLSSAIAENRLNFPDARSLPGRAMKIPYVIVADDAFALSTKMMKPYPSKNLTHDKKIFNYRLSRARRVVENAFGILANRFRVLLTTIHLAPSKVQTVTLACIVLHNFLIEENTIVPNVDQNEDSSNANILTQISRQVTNTRSTTTALKIRDEFKDYFISPNGRTEFQERAIQKHNL